MNKESLSRLRKPLRLLLSISIIVAGLCLMGACVYIYRSGDQPFSREAVAAAFGPISIPVYLCLGLVVLSIAAELLLPRSAEKRPPVRQVRMTLQRMQERTDLALCSEELRSQVLALRNDRKLYDGIGRTVLILSSILFLTYGMNARNFHSTHINQSMIRAMFWLLPCSAVPFVYGLFAAAKNRLSMEKELELLKTAPKESRISTAKPRSHRQRDFYLRSALVLIGIVILVYGFLAGGTADVLTKAVNICTECVGLG